MSTPANMSLPSPLPLSNRDLEPGISPGVLSSSLPFPDPSSLNTPPTHKKKSHARKQPAGHVPRPRNAFILFRCDFVRQKKVPDHVEANHRNISRIVGSVWKNMSASQKAPWIAMADLEKKNHAKAHPGYKYHPGYDSRGRDLRIRKVLHSPTDSCSGKGISPVMSPEWTPSPSFTPPIVPSRRSSSCPPPGAFPVLRNPSLGLTHGDQLGLSIPSMTRDDLARRPSRTIMYQSGVPLYSFEPDPAGPPPTSTGNAFSGKWWATDPGSGSPLTTGPYTIAPPGDAPGWDAAPTQPNTWYSWSEGGQATVYGLNNVNTNFDTLASQWNNDRAPTFTNPFGSVPDTTLTNDTSLTWNFDPSAISTMGNIPGQSPMPVELLPNTFDFASHLEPTIHSSGAPSVEDLDHLFRTRMSLVEANPEFPKAEQNQPQLYWGAQEQATSEVDLGILPTLYLRDENGLYYNPVDEVHKSGREGRDEPVKFPQNDYPAAHSFNEAGHYSANEFQRIKTRKDWWKSRVRPSAASFLPSSSPPTIDGPSAASSSKIELPRVPPIRRPILSPDDLMRLTESAGMRGNERVTPEKYQQFRASLTEHYFKRVSASKRETQEDKSPEETNYQGQTYPVSQGDVTIDSPGCRLIAASPSRYGLTDI